jgi:hypothetical protein
VTTCDWAVDCAEQATHTVTVQFPEMDAAEVWAVCRRHDRELKTVAIGSRRIQVPLVDPPPLRATFCGSCDKRLDEDAGLPFEQRLGCPECASTARLVKVVVTAQLSTHADVLVRAKRAGRGGWIVKMRTGDDYVRQLDGWGKRELLLDRECDQYREIIELPDDSRIESRAALSDHHD